MAWGKLKSNACRGAPSIQNLLSCVLNSFLVLVDAGTCLGPGQCVVGQLHRVANVAFQATRCGASPCPVHQARKHPEVIELGVRDDLQIIRCDHLCIQITNRQVCAVFG